jgi:hypothetical protein
MHVACALAKGAPRQLARRVQQKEAGALELNRSAISRQTIFFGYGCLRANQRMSQTIGLSDFCDFHWMRDTATYMQRLIARLDHALETISVVVAPEVVLVAGVAHYRTAPARSVPGQGFTYSLLLRCARAACSRRETEKNHDAHAPAFRNAANGKDAERIQNIAPAAGGGVAPRPTRRRSAAAAKVVSDCHAPGSEREPGSKGRRPSSGERTRLAKVTQGQRQRKTQGGQAYSEVGIALLA